MAQTIYILIFGTVDAAEEGCGSSIVFFGSFHPQAPTECLIGERSVSVSLDAPKLRSSIPCSNEIGAEYATLFKGDSTVDIPSVTFELSHPYSRRGIHVPMNSWVIAEAIVQRTLSEVFTPIPGTKRSDFLLIVDMPRQGADDYLEKHWQRVQTFQAIRSVVILERRTTPC